MVFVPSNRPTDESVEAPVEGFGVIDEESHRESQILHAFRVEGAVRKVADGRDGPANFFGRCSLENSSLRVHPLRLASGSCVGDMEQNGHQNDAVSQRAFEIEGTEVWNEICGNVRWQIHQGAIETAVRVAGWREESAPFAHGCEAERVAFLQR